MTVNVTFISAATLAASLCGKLSADDCCNGPLTGYSLFTGRSRSPFGPFVDRQGNSLLDGTHWVHGATWDHQLGSQARLGLVAMGGSGFVAEFKYARISRPFLSNPLNEAPRTAP